jgi:hypothetical protein
MFGKVILDKETNKIYLRVNEFILSNFKVIKLAMRIKGEAFLILGALTGALALLRLRRPI